jgi:hypothetical protein
MDINPKEMKPMVFLIFLQLLLKMSKAFKKNLMLTLLIKDTGELIFFSSSM